MINNLLSRLDHVKQTGVDRWIARCPAHDDKSPSLTIRETDDGRILIHCFAGCDTHSILAAVGLDMTALFPERLASHGKPVRRPFPAADVLRCVAHESEVVAAVARLLTLGSPLTLDLTERLQVANERLQRAADIGLGRI